MIFKSLLRPTNSKRTAFFLLGDVLLVSLSFYLGFYLRFGFDIPPQYLRVFFLWLPAVLAIKTAVLALMKQYSVSWRFISLKELTDIVKTVVFSTGIILFLNREVMTKWPEAFVPRGVLLIDSAFCLVFITGFRVSKRLYLAASEGVHHGKRTLIVGAGRTGERLARELLRSSKEDLYPVAFVDDDPAVKGTRIHGVPVVDSCQGIDRVVEKNRINTAIIALPTASHKKIREVFHVLSERRITDVRVVPRISQWSSEAISVKNMESIRLEDLLPRKTVRVETSAIRDFVQDRTILVTGAGGSIGAEIVRQMLRFSPKRIIAYEIDETELYNLQVELGNHILILFLGDIRYGDKLEPAFRRFRPEIVFHAAAYKHVPMMENFPQEAVGTNIFGTKNLADLSVEYEVRQLVNISTDKAVNPTSIMGATKRIAELICGASNQLGKTKFVSVRFGNVLGSRGSALSVFLEQIKRGGPVCVTHPDMKRYFMSIPEAVLLVSQAAAMGNGGEVFVLDMGEPVRIAKVAEDLIRLHGLRPHEDIEVIFTQPRPGEKLFEQLLTAEEGTSPTAHEKIFVARNHFDCGIEKIEKIVAELRQNRSDPDELRKILKRHVPFYRKTSLEIGPSGHS